MKRGRKRKWLLPLVRALFNRYPTIFECKLIVWICTRISQWAGTSFPKLIWNTISIVCHLRRLKRLIHRWASRMRSPGDTPPSQNHSMLVPASSCSSPWRSNPKNRVLGGITSTTTWTNTKVPIAQALICMVKRRIRRVRGCRCTSARVKLRKIVCQTSSHQSQ